MHHHTQSPSHAGARGVADDKYRGGVRQQNGRLSLNLHQTGKRQRLRYPTVQNTVICSLAREKANLRNMLPDVIAQTDKINEGSKCNLAEQKADLVGVLQKRQRNFGRFEAMKYFKHDDNKRPTWLAPIFNNAKEEGALNADGIEHLCHLEKELSSMKL